MFNRDGSRIVSEFKPPDGPEDWDERHTVVLPDGSKFTFENSGKCATQPFNGEGRLVSATEWTDTSRPLPTGQLAFVGPAISAGANLASRLGPAAVQALNAAALTFFTWLVEPQYLTCAAVFAFNAKKYEKPENRMRSTQLFSWDFSTRTRCAKGMRQAADARNSRTLPSPR